MRPEAFRIWEKAHPLGSELQVNVAGESLLCQVSEFSDYHGKVEVRCKVKEKR